MERNVWLLSADARRGSGGTRDESLRKSALEARVRVAWLSKEITSSWNLSYQSVQSPPLIFPPCSFNKFAVFFLAVSAGNEDNERF